MLTKDGFNVNIGDKVWVFGSTGVHEATVLQPVTSYEYFGPIPVSESYSSKEAALAAKKKKKC